MNTKNNTLYLSIVIFYSFLINWFSANIGVLPIDTFGFFDTGYGILKGQLPISDYWAYTGVVVDYFQAFFFYLFGNNWNSYVIHSSMINVLASVIFYLFLLKIKLPNIFSFFYTLSFATLLYPVSGTPFAYLHAYIFSLVAIIILFISYYTDNIKLLIYVPIALFFSFFSMQTPSIYILGTIVLFIFYIIFFEKNIKIIKYLFYGVLICLLIFTSYIFISKIEFKDLVYQYFLFPITIVDGRISGDMNAYLTLKNQLNFKRIFGDFKFLHLFLIPLILIQIPKIINKNFDKIFLISLAFILSTFLFLYNQLLQANQTYIFSLIPFAAALLHKNILSFFSEKKIYFLSMILSIVILATYKFHLRFNVERKFIDLENKSKSNFVYANEIHKNLDNLKWISNFTNPKKDKVFLKKVISILQKERESSYLITHYNFFSTILDKNFYILNRWYLFDNNRHPTEGHIYFKYYKEFVNKNFEKNKIKTIYLINEDQEFTYNKIKGYFHEKCFDETELDGKRLIKLTLKKCI